MIPQDRATAAEPGAAAAEACGKSTEARAIVPNGGRQASSAAARAWKLLCWTRKGRIVIYFCFGETSFTEEMGVVLFIR